MTQEDRELLLKDLCARLPYGVILNTPNGNNSLLALVSSKEYNTIIEYDDYRGNDISEWKGGDIEFVKPYLRPMSSMTEEEKKELKNLFDAEEVTSDSICYLEGGTLEEYLSHISYSFCSKIIDWLNKNHFDYRGLIEKGLAISVTKDYNPYKQETK